MFGTPKVFNQILVFILLLGHVTFAQDSLTRFRYSDQVMGTTFSLTFFADDQERADHASRMAIQKLHFLNQIFSDYDPDSEASLLAAKAGEKVQVSNELWHLVKLSKKLGKRTKGAFDITVGPLTKLWRRAIRQQSFPDSTKINQAQRLVDYKMIKLFPKNQEIKLLKPGMRLDFGGIAKGYAIDQCYRILAEEGMVSILVEGGGDLFFDQNPPDRSNYKILSHTGNVLMIEPPVAIASSGDSYQKLHWNGKRYSHIIDPVQGIGLADSKIYTVAANNATIADALATTMGVISEKHRKRVLNYYHARLISTD